jgi:hypothetical protein
MDKIMSNTSKLRIEDVEAFTITLSGANTFTAVRKLRDDELLKVSGGVRKGGAIIVYDYEGSAPAKVTVPDIKLG